MKFLKNAPWATIMLLAGGWVIAWLVVDTFVSFAMLRSFVGSATSASGGIGAVGIGFSAMGLAVVIGPPLLLMLLKLIVPLSKP